MNTTIPPVNYEILHSIVHHLCDSDHVARALHNYPKAVEQAIPSLKEAAGSLDLPTKERIVDPAKNTATVGRIQLYRDQFAKPDFWRCSGMTSQQIAAIAKAFEAAIPKIQERSRAAQVKNEEKHRKREFNRKIEVDKRKRPFMQREKRMPGCPDHP